MGDIETGLPVWVSPDGTAGRFGYVVNVAPRTKKIRVLYERKADTYAVVTVDLICVELVMSRLTPAKQLAQQRRYLRRVRARTSTATKAALAGARTIELHMKGGE